METIDETTGSGWAKYGIIAAVLLVALFVFGLVGQLAGAGWFGYRTTLYGTGDLYALNMSEKPLYVSVDGRERAKVPPRNAEIVEIIGGTSTVEVSNESGEVVARYEISAEGSDAFLKLTDEGCLAAVDLTGYYGGKSKSSELEIVEEIGPEDRVWVPDSTNVIWPRKPFPTRLAAEGGRGVWLELVACELFDEPDFLHAYLDLRLRERMEKALGGDGERGAAPR